MCAKLYYNTGSEALPSVKQRKLTETDLLQSLEELVCGSPLQEALQGFTRTVQKTSEPAGRDC
ncbi:hypothetical protein EK904_001536 [Melospiza melodia maxima]|nr:hypothetical protein EK904_001536 [Melospiza melodia maxima]